MEKVELLRAGQDHQKNTSFLHGQSNEGELLKTVQRSHRWFHNLLEDKEQQEPYKLQYIVTNIGEMKRNDELSQEEPTQIEMDMDIELMQDVEIEEVMDEVKEEGL